MMSAGSIKYAKIPCQTWRNGVPSAVSWADFGFYTWSKTDAVRRKRPKGVDQLKQATAVSYESSRLVDAQMFYSYVNGAREKVDVMTSLMRDSPSAGLGRGGEMLPTQGNAIVRNKLLAKSRDSSVNLANALGEYRQTAKMFADCAKFVAGACKALKTGDPRMLYLARKNLARNMSQSVLMVQYGVRPLIQDINESISVLKKAGLEKPLVVRNDASHTDRLKVEYKITDSLYKTSGPLYCTLEKRYKAWSLVELQNAVLNTTLGQFGFTNPLGVAWELTPFSFVADWWFNVGEMLAGLDNCLYFKDGIYQVSTYEVYAREAHLHNAVGTYREIKAARTAVMPLGTMPSPVYKLSISRQHILNGTALLGQYLTKHKPANL